MTMTRITSLAASTVLLVCFQKQSHTHAYRIQGSEDENKPFVPYEKGFVGHVEDPDTAPRTRTNQGYASSVLLGDGVGKNRLFSCPMMVGPFDDQKYYCRGKEYGYCDRRSGTCFCNEGYMGDSCDSCAPTHFELGGLCYPKRLCPNDCSFAGDCDYLTGKCQCHDHRMGEDCSESQCLRFHQFCTHCNDGGCIECEEGFSVDDSAPLGSQCEPCYRFDPRCRNCDKATCTMCVDLLLLSIHRSGRRPQDPPLPIDEMTRELSIIVPFGSTQEDAFYDAEHYFLVEPDMIPLNETAMECHQGLNDDDTISCVPYNMTSHVMCGNHGTITFDSPEYAISEDAKHIRLTVRRTGGGVGEVSVSYSIYPITAGYEDFTATAYYTTNQTITFQPGQISASFLLAINDDRVLEQNETFSVHLSNPTGSAKLGTQQRTIVTIIDDDEERTCSQLTFIDTEDDDLGFAVAGSIPLDFNIFAKSCTGSDQSAGGDVFKVIAHSVGVDNVPRDFDKPAAIGVVVDLGDGRYECTVNATSTGIYDLYVFQLVSGGLKGHYFTDDFFSESRLDFIRIDAVVNFTWGTGPVTTFGRDFVSVRWEGFVQPLYSEPHTFWLDVDDHARLWVDGILLIDWWISRPASGMLSAELDLIAYETHEIVLEYRDVLNNATARLLWSSENTPLQAIPSSSLFYKEPIDRIPKRFTVLPSASSAHESSASGDGLVGGVAGKEHSFIIRPKDSFGNFRGWPSEAIANDSRHVDNFNANATLDDSLVVPVSIIYDEETRHFVGSYTPIVSGHYKLNIALSDKLVLGSPFPVDTRPGETFAPKSVASGEGLRYGTAGKKSSFVIRSHDLHGNRKQIGGDNWVITVASVLNPNDYHYGSIVDFGNGTYSVDVVPETAGPNMLSITLGAVHIQKSPFSMAVIHSEVSGPASSVIL